jgi:anti-anti-sigma regulatory factor
VLESLLGVHDEDGQVTVVVPRLDGSGSERDRSIEDELANLQLQSCQALCVDLRQVVFMSGRFNGCLVRMMKPILKRSARVTLLVTPELRELYRTINFDRICEIVCNEE